MRVIKYILILLCGLFLYFLINLSTKSDVYNSLKDNKQINILLIGTDNDEFKHADAILLLSYNPNNRKFSLFSIPNSLAIEGNIRRTKRINKVFADYYKLTKKDVKQASKLMKNFMANFLGIDIPFYVQIDYSKFGEIIDTLDGVNMEVIQPMHYDDSVNNVHIHFDKGNYVLNGKKSVEFMRYLDEEGDLDRTIRHQDLVVRLLNRMFSPYGKINWVNLYKIFKNINTNLNIMDFFSLAVEYKNFDIDNFIKIQIPVEIDKYNNLVFDKKIFFLLYFNYNMDYMTKSGQITAEVWNASGKVGEAINITRFLRKNSVDVRRWGNYGKNKPVTIIIDRVGNWKNAKYVADLMHCNNVFTQINRSMYVDVTIIIGQNSN